MDRLKILLDKYIRGCRKIGMTEKEIEKELIKIYVDIIKCTR
jgi:hypothetical protein